VDSLTGIEPGSFLENFGNAFFFSIQTFTTVGYGVISPKTWFADFLAASNALIGLMSFALATGLFFARFAKPSARILFSKFAIISNIDGGSSLQFRIANRRDKQLIDLEAKVNITWIENLNGERIRRFSTLSLERDKITLFPLNWTIVHKIDKNSPLFGLNQQEIIEKQFEILVLVEGFDSTYSQQVYCNSSYTCHELVWDVRFQRMFHPDEGQILLDLDKIDHTNPIYSIEEEE